MKQFDLWLKACAEKNDYPFLLNSCKDYDLYKLSGKYTVKNNDYYSPTYHVWDRKNDKWVFTSVDYRAAYQKYKNIIFKISLQ